MKKLFILSILGILFYSCNDKKKEQEIISEEQNLEIHEKIALANGLEEFDSINKIEFTFNVSVNDTLRSERKWTWDTRTDRITLIEKDSTMSYIRQDSIEEANQYIDQRFINDSYWLLFPFQLEWSDANFSEVKTATAPISKKDMQMLTVNYRSEGGYTPGDSYDIYFDDEFMIREWVYHSADGNNQMATTWEDYDEFKDIKVAKMHKSEDGSFKLFFTDIAVE
ncbi:hypothetical protein [Christiangramia sabulilitoris]|uniref:Selenophosphate synthetase n=1 Tax=Christiangramia sabulilitoris TaxID=2583991 RepID=A0A550I3N5_9FLAO|nr:hypothetical protein [Christiangramia sabulilitoris]TRO65587.1 hypothetical protein FGM01_09315 [Christiangramia sabulilitoris]